MNGHVRKRGSSYEVILDLGRQPAQRCPACMAKKGRAGGRLLWTEDTRLDACPVCGGELEDVTGRRQLVVPERFKTERAAAKRLRQELTAADEGAFVEPSTITLGDYLTEVWLPSLAGEELAPGTVRLYRVHVDQRLVPVLGKRPLQALRGADVTELKTHMATHKGVRGKLPSAQTRRQTVVVLHKALGAAVRDGYLPRNPAQGVRPPRVRRREVTTWTAGELRTFLASTRGDRLAPLWRFLSQTGLRRGEALGLCVEALKLDAGKVEVLRQRRQDGYAVEEAELKAGERRTISIDARTVEALRAQAAQQLEDAAMGGDKWTATGFVFTREDGLPWHPDRVTKLFDVAVKTAGVPRIRLHDLRHTWATLALRAGVHPKVVQERLGHKRIGMTLDTYSHVLPDMQEAAAKLVAALVDGEAT